MQNINKEVVFDLPSKKNCSLKLAGTTKHPYFFSKDLCKILSDNQEKYNKKLQEIVEKHLDDEERKYITDFKLNGVLDDIYLPTIGGVNLSRGYVLGKDNMCNENRDIYVNKYGVKTLLRFSKNKNIAKEFKNFMWKKLLPSFSQYEEYKYMQKFTQEYNGVLNGDSNTNPKDIKYISINYTDGSSDKIEIKPKINSESFKSEFYFVVKHLEIKHDDDENILFQR